MVRGENINYIGMTTEGNFRMEDSMVSGKFKDFEKSLGYAPADKVSKKFYGDMTPATIYGKRSYSKLTGLVVKSDNIDFYLYAAAILGSAPALSHAMRYVESDPDRRVVIKGQATIEVFHILKDLLNSTYDSFDSYWNRLAAHLEHLRSYWRDELHENNFTYGNAQKWISVSIKHLFALLVMSANDDIREYTKASLFGHAGMPIDDLIERYLKLPESGIEIHFDRAPYSNKISWGNVDDLDIFYRYQRDVLAKVLDLNKADSLFEYELNAWGEAAKMAKETVTTASGKQKSLLLVRAKEVNASFKANK